MHARSLYATPSGSRTGKVRDPSRTCGARLDDVAVLGKYVAGPRVMSVSARSGVLPSIVCCSASLTPAQVTTV